jgi:hypothetical protein
MGAEGWRERRAGRLVTAWLGGRRGADPTLDHCARGHARTTGPGGCSATGLDASHHCRARKRHHHAPLVGHQSAGPPLEPDAVVAVEPVPGWGIVAICHQRLGVSLPEDKSRVRSVCVVAVLGVWSPDPPGLVPGGVSAHAAGSRHDLSRLVGPTPKRPRLVLDRLLDRCLPP